MLIAFRVLLCLAAAVVVGATAMHEKRSAITIAAGIVTGLVLVAVAALL